MISFEGRDRDGHAILTRFWGMWAQCLSRLILFFEMKAEMTCMGKDDVNSGRDENSMENTLRSRREIDASSAKSVRTMLLAVLLQVCWPKRLTKEDIVRRIPLYGSSQRQRAVERDIKTLTATPVDALPEPGDPGLDEWCKQQQRMQRLAITYERQTRTFALAQSIFSLDISEEEARAFVALQDGFTPGTPFAESVQQLLKRWEWQFNEKSRQLLHLKRKRQARAVLLPLSPVVDYSQHNEIILKLDEALEEHAYVSFAYAPLTQSWDDEPIWHEHTEPYELEYRDGHWYYTGYVSDLNTFLDYRVDRIRPGSLRKEHERFYPGSRHRSGIKIKYWVSPMLARHGSLSVRLHDQHMTLMENDQGAIVEGYAKSLWWARRLLLGYGEQVKALEPQELVEMMRETAQAMGRLYEEGK
jgi:predicted DNA-binding transcriptional regulator YafY